MKRYSSNLVFTLAVTLLTLGVQGYAVAQPAVANKPTGTEASTSSSQQRISDRKAALKTKPDAAQQKNLQLKCQNAQKVLDNLYKQSETIASKRMQTYSDVAGRLNGISDRLSAQNVDTTKLKEQQASLESLIKVMQNNLTSYRQALSDAASMDCKTDPVGFRASVDAAKEARVRLASSAKDIELHTTQSIVPTLKEYKSKVK